jgi:hypothetical protein
MIWDIVNNWSIMQYVYFGVFVTVIVAGVIYAWWRSTKTG